MIDSAIQDDHLWFYTKNGEYTVRLRYHALMEKQYIDKGSEGQVAADVQARMWKQFWKLNMLPKAKEFVWRAAKDILPCKTNLLRWKISTDDCCSLCGRSESGFNVFFECWPARQVWKASSLYRFRVGESLKMQVLSSVFLIGSVIERKRWVLTLWHIWKERNRRVFDGIDENPMDVGKGVGDLLNYFLGLVNSVGVKTPTAKPPDGRKWLKPMADYIKINCDASMN